MSFDIKQLVECDGCMAICACWSGLGFVRLLEMQRAILEDRRQYTVVLQRYCRKLSFQAYRPRSFLCLR